MRSAAIRKLRASLASTCSSSRSPSMWSAPCLQGLQASCSPRAWIRFSPPVGFGYELDTIAAVVIGGTSLSGGAGGIGGTLIGVLIIGVLRNGLNLLNVSPFLQQVIIGVVIVLAVGAETMRRRRA